MCPGRPVIGRHACCEPPLLSKADTVSAVGLRYPHGPHGSPGINRLILGQPPRNSHFAAALTASWHKGEVHGGLGLSAA